MIRLYSFVRRYCADLSGAIIVAFAVMAPIIIGSAGMALDFSQAYLVQQRLAQAIDAAALAGASTSSDPDEIEAKVQQFFDANYPPEELGITFDPEVHVNGNEIQVSGHATYITFFLNVIGIDDITVEAETIVQRQIKGLEVVLVLDNTGSMAENNNIGTLKTATKDFINVIFANTDNPLTVRIGLVPYSNSVRVGRYGLGQNPDGTDYNEGTVFVTLPSGVNYTTTYESADWFGCVVEHKATNYSSSATHVSGSKGQLWKNGSSWNGHGWNPGSTTNDPYSSDVLDDYTGPWDIYAFGRVIAQNQKCSDYSGYSNSRCSSCTGTDSKCSTNYCFCWPSNSSDGINQGCPRAYIMPLTSVQEDLLDRVDEMSTEGNTLGNIGMAWGYRVISPEEPFTEGSDWDSDYWQKAVIMMTDGDNTENGTYSSYWFTPKNNMTVTKFNTRFAETCEAMKEKGITVYTVTFTSAINTTTKNYYKNCATSTSHYYDAPTQAKLKEVFENISRELSNLHIKS